MIGSVQMDTEHAIPLRFSHLGKRDLFGNPRIAEENVNPSKGLLRLCNCLLDFFKPTDIDPKRQRTPTEV